MLCAGFTIVLQQNRPIRRRDVVLVVDRHVADADGELHVGASAEREAVAVAQSDALEVVLVAAELAARLDVELSSVCIETKAVTEELGTLSLSF